MTDWGKKLVRHVPLFDGNMTHDKDFFSLSERGILT